MVVCFAQSPCYRVPSVWVGSFRFAQYGPVRRVWMPSPECDARAGKAPGTGVALVDFADAETAQQAVENQGSQISTQILVRSVFRGCTFQLSEWLTVGQRLRIRFLILDAQGSIVTTARESVQNRDTGVSQRWCDEGCAFSQSRLFLLRFCDTLSAPRITSSSVQTPLRIIPNDPSAVSRRAGSARATGPIDCSLAKAIRTQDLAMRCHRRMNHCP